MGMDAGGSGSVAVEEYLQAIYTLADDGGQVIGARIAELLGLSAPAVSEMLHRMERDGLITLADRKEVRFTERGAVEAASVVRRHRLIERMLTDLMGYEWWETHDEAERLEHAISPEMESRLMKRLGDPQTCPHGNPMPGVTARPSRPLDSLRAGAEALIERVPDKFEHEPGFLKYLASKGIKPGLVARMLETPAEGPLRVAIDGVAQELRRDCGLKVWVRA